MSKPPRRPPTQEEELIRLQLIGERIQHRHKVDALMKVADWIGDGDPSPFFTEAADILEEASWDATDPEVKELHRAAVARFRRIAAMLRPE
jgi:hypothetical protein